MPQQTLKWDDLEPADHAAAEASVAASRARLDSSLTTYQTKKAQALQSGYGEVTKWDDLTPVEPQSGGPAVKPAGPEKGFSWRDGKSGQGAASLVSTAKPAAKGEDNTRLTAGEHFDPLPEMKPGEFREMVRASGRQPLHSHEKGVLPHPDFPSPSGYGPAIEQTADVLTRPFQLISTFGAGLFRKFGADVNAAFSKDPRIQKIASEYGWGRLFEAAAERFYTGHAPEGFELPAEVVYDYIVEKAGGDPNSLLTQVGKGTVGGLTDPTSYIAPEAIGKQLTAKGRAGLPEELPRLPGARPSPVEQPKLAELPEAPAAAGKLMSKPRGKVLAHVAGPSGAGKTEIANALGEKVKNIALIDLDAFDDAAVKRLGWEKINKDDFTDEMLSRLHEEKQGIVDRFIEKSRKPIVFFGHHIEGGHALDLGAAEKLLLDVDPQAAARRVVKRPGRAPGQFKQAVETGRRDVDELTAAGYKPTKPRAVFGQIQQMSRQAESRLPELPKTPEIEQSVAALESKGSKIKTKAAGPKAAITETDTDSNTVTVNTDKLKGSPEHQARQIEEGVRHEAGHVDLAEDTPEIRDRLQSWLKEQVDTGQMSFETAAAHLREIEADGAKKWQDAHPDASERFVEAATKTGTKYEPPAELPPVPDSATPASKGKASVPEWVKSNLDTITASAEKSGLADQIEELAAQRLTARQIASRLDMNTPDGRSLIRAVRTKRGIPSLEAGEQATEFEQWLANRKKPSSPEQPGLAPLPDAPEGSGYGAGAMKVGQPANASEMAQLTESIAAQEKGKKAPPLRDLGEKAKATGQSITERATAAGDYLKRAFEGLRDPLKITDVDRAVGVLGREHQVSAIEVNAFTDAVRKAVPDALRREAVYNYAVAQGDQALLQKWAGASEGRTRKGYELAQQLTDAEKTVADNFKNIFEPLYQEAFHAGVLNSFIDDYVRQWVKKAPKGSSLDKNLAKAKAQIDMRLLDPNFKAARQRIFLNPFEGEQAGYQYHKDFAKVLADYYVGMKRAIASRKFIADLQGSTASDNRPVTAVAGVGRPIESPTGATEAYAIRPRAKAVETSDYLPVEHPAFKGWKWVERTEEGTPIYTQGEMLVHPEYAERLRRMFQKSGIRNYEVAGLKPFGGLLKVQQELKSSLFAGGFFHHVTEGVHALGHRINPFTNLPELKATDARLLRAMESGLQVADFHGQEMFADGLAGPGSLFNKFILDPLTAGKATEYQQWLFGSYIPRLKYKTYLHMLERNRSRFGLQKSAYVDPATGETVETHIGRGKVTDEQVQMLSARQANAAFGELNYLQMARSKTAQDLSRLFFTAPDFLEARGRFVGQALAPYGAEQRVAIGTLALTQYMTARIFNKALNDDYHWDTPFGLIVNGREYSFRSVPGDIYHLMSDWRGFAAYRLNPFTVGLGSELALGRDPQGRYETAGGAVGGALKRAVPIPLQGVVKGTDENLIQSVLKVAGIENWKYRTKDERVALERLKETSPKRDLPPDQQKRADLRRKVESEIRHGADAEAVIRQHDKELSPGDKIDLRKSGKQKGGEGAAYALLAGNDLDGFEAAFKAATPERQKAVYAPLLRRKLAELSGQGRAGASAKYKLTFDERQRMKARINAMLNRKPATPAAQFPPVP